MLDEVKMKKIKNKVIKKNEIEFIVKELNNLNSEIRTSFKMMDDILESLKDENKIGTKIK